MYVPLSFNVTLYYVYRFLMRYILYKDLSIFFRYCFQFVWHGGKEFLMVLLRLIMMESWPTGTMSRLKVLEDISVSLVVLSKSEGDP